MPQPFEHEIEVFNIALELPAGERAAYLDRACPGDAALRQRVEELLKANEESCACLEGSAAVTPGPGGTVQSTFVPAEKPGDRIGRYKLLQQIGEGGCGVVYMAEQEEPVRRRVALKVIKLGMDTKSVIARFEAERQALALMDHPNIAKVLDAGATETGRPFFVMELVRGIKITDFCDHSKVPTQDRLKLFIQVCQAIQHAHQKGIIHRDIKPSNILVTVNDGVAVPKVIDFGIAKATQGKLTDHTLFTAFEQFIGTPAYMSPEQAVMTSLDIDTRSDIYSLGVLLYEMLTGRTPFDASDLLAGGMDEMRRTIREKEPPKPSTRLTQELLAADVKLHSKPAIKDPKFPENVSAASVRRLQIQELIHHLRGDLDWIVMKCLEKDRARRYETANGLAADIQRHLSNEPVVACPPGNLYKFQKLVRRNKVAFIAASIVTAALIIGLGVSTWMFFNELKAREQAEAERKIAQTEATRSRQVARFLKDMLNGVGPSVALGRDTTVLREILDRTAERIGEDLTNQPAVQAELQDTIGNAYNMVGEVGKAEIMLRQGLATRRRLFGNEDPSVAESLRDLGVLRKEQAFGAEGEVMQREALAIRRKKLGNQSPLVADSLFNLASIISLGRPAEAESLLREALAIDRKVWGEGSAELAQPVRLLALVLSYQRKLPEAESLGRQALDIDLKRPGSGHPEVAASERFLADILDRENKFKEAEAMARAALALRRKVCADQPGVVADSLNVLASVLYDADKLKDCEADALEAADIENKIGPNKPMLGWSLETLALVHGRMGHWQEAIGDLTPLAELEPSNAFMQFSLAASLLETGNLPDYRARCQKIAAAFGESSDCTKLFAAAQACLLIPGGGCDLETAVQLADRAVVLGRDHPGIHYIEFGKGLAEYRRGHFTNSIGWLEKAIQGDKTTPDDNNDMAAYAVMAMAENQLQHPAPAQAALADSLGIAQTKVAAPGSADLGADWHTWLVAHILLREAQAQLTTP